MLSGSKAFCIVAYKSLSWMPIVTHSFHEHFPDENLIVVDNNANNSEERDYLLTLPFCKVIEPLTDRSHGGGIDAAVIWARENDYRYLTLLEPDCLILGTKWLKNLESAISEGNIMAGSHKKFFGPIHPTPSMWDLNFVTDTFKQIPRGEDALEPRFSELVDLGKLLSYCKTKYETSVVEWFENYWDTGHKPWFTAALSNKASLVPNGGDFIHFWKGSETTPSISHHPAISKYLR